METIFGQIDEKANFTETIRLDINKMPSSDPIAFSYGISRGIQFNKQKVADKYYSPTYEQIHGSKYRELAKEYLRGFKLGYRGILLPEGTPIRKGTEFTFFDMDKNILKKE